ncbi:MAG TPA: DUF1289 domain-containing protein [Moraxellaceae bacterium]
MTSLSPCIGLCRLDEDRLCQGCLRHIDEIARWGLLPPDEQRKILALVAQRRAALAIPAPTSTAMETSP